uniref:BED-type domain-containing protein n=1 Tax=Arundo donax TaxID=35708 RepID=A0A0A9CXS6_ARUDO
MSQTQQSVELDSPSTQNDGTGTAALQQEEGQPKRQTRKRKSPLWNFFEEIEVPSKKKRGEMESKVKCKACGTQLSKNKSGTTSHWGRHLEQCESFKCQQKSKIQTTINFHSCEGDVEGDLPALSTPGFYDPAKIRELICKMIIVHELPFSIVEYSWFNVLLKALNCAYKKVSRITIRNDCMRLYESEKDLLKKSFKHVNRISLTCDLWTSNQTICYMSLVAHYIDANWTMQCRVINFMELDPPHTGVVISNAISDCLAAWKIEDKIASITFDNASNNDTAVKLLLAKFTNRGTLWFNGKFLHNRCCAHILNLVVQDGLQVIGPLIDKVRETIKYIKKSNSRSYKFNADVDSLNLDRRKKMVLDVCTRWGSTYKMLESAFHYRAAIDVYAAGDANYRWQPTEAEWMLYKEISNVLGVLHAATEEFSGSKYPTSNLFYPHIVNVKKALCELKRSKEIVLQKMADAMMEKFDKYWGPDCNTLFAIATILDPRFKMGMIQFTFPSMYSEIELPEKLVTVESTLHELYGIYESAHNQSMSSLKNTESTSPCVSASDSTNSVFSSACEFQQFVKAQTAAHPSKPDLRKYLEDPVEVIAPENFDILQWWKLHEINYPILAKMAKDVLSVPISTVSSESSFSAGGRVVDDYRSSLLPSTVQALVCTSSWIRGGSHSLPELEDDANSIPLLSTEHPSAVSVVGSN